MPLVRLSVLASSLLAIAPFVLLAAACDEPEPYRGDVCTREEQRTIPLLQKPALDVLVVLDRTPSMADQAADVQRLAETTKTVLEQVGGGVPDLHLAVVTSDLGASGVAGCTASGDGAAFQGAARCRLDGAFLSARGLVDGGVSVAGEGTFASALACLYDAPMSTCPVSQPLGAAVRALDGSVAGNAGFRRDYAALIVVVVTDGDDCTLVTPTALADVTAANDLEGAIDFACFARGTTCTPTDATTNGAHTGCVPRSDAGIADVAVQVARLGRLVEDPRNLVITTIAAPFDPVVQGGNRLASACGTNGAVTPSPRLAAVTLPERSSITSVCDDWSDAVIWFAQLIREPLGVACIDAKLDLDTSTPGFQTNCVNRIAGADGHTIAPLPWCDAPGVDRSHPCIEPLVPDPQQCPGDGAVSTPGAALQVSLGDTRLPEELYADLRCEVACE